MSTELPLELLRCPKTKSPLVREGETLVSVDPAWRLRYEIRDDIPILLVSEATELSPEQWREIMQRHGRPVDA